MSDYLIDKQKLLWHPDRIAAWQRDRLVSPIYVEISPLSYCNHKCIFCGIDFAQERTTRLDEQVLHERLEEMARLGVKSVMFAGEGEPLLHKSLPLFIATARRAGMDVAITTNGSPATPDLWQKLLPDCTWIKFSIDAGTSEVFSKVHGVAPEAFERVIANIASAQRLKQEQGLNVTLGVLFLLIDENLHDLEPAMKLFCGLGLDYLVLKPYLLHPQMLAQKNVVYSLETIEQVESLITRYQAEGKTKIIFRKDSVLKYLHDEKSYQHCYALPFWGYISSQGDFYTCSVFIGKEQFKVGNIYQENMEQILYGERRRQSLLYGEERLDVCGECRTNCRMARVNEFLEFLVHQPDHVNFI